MAKKKKKDVLSKALRDYCVKETNSWIDSQYDDYNLNYNNNYYVGECCAECGKPSTHSCYCDEHKHLCSDFTITDKKELRKAFRVIEV